LGISQAIHDQYMRSTRFLNQDGYGTRQLASTLRAILERYAFGSSHQPCELEAWYTHDSSHTQCEQVVYIYIYITYVCMYIPIDPGLSLARTPTHTPTHTDTHTYTHHTHPHPKTHTHTHTPTHTHTHTHPHTHTPTHPPKAFTNGGEVVRPIGLRFSWVNTIVLGSSSIPKAASQEPPKAPPIVYQVSARRQPRGVLRQSIQYFKDWVHGGCKHNEFMQK
jgi:hypothetical protein